MVRGPGSVLVGCMLVRAHMCVLVMSCANPLMMCSLRFRAATSAVSLALCVCVSRPLHLAYLQYRVPGAAKRHVPHAMNISPVGDFSFGIESLTLRRYKRSSRWQGWGRGSVRGVGNLLLLILKGGPCCSSHYEDH